MYPIHQEKNIKIKYKFNFHGKGEKCKITMRTHKNGSINRFRPRIPKSIFLILRIQFTTKLVGGKSGVVRCIMNNQIRIGVLMIFQLKSKVSHCTFS